MPVTNATVSKVEAICLYAAQRLNRYGAGIFFPIDAPHLCIRLLKSGKNVVLGVWQ